MAEKPWQAWTRAKLDTDGPSFKNEAREEATMSDDKRAIEVLGSAAR